MSEKTEKKIERINPPELPAELFLLVVRSIDENCPFVHTRPFPCFTRQGAKESAAFWEMQPGTIGTSITRYIREPEAGA